LVVVRVIELSGAGEKVAFKLRRHLGRKVVVREPVEQGELRGINR